MDIQLTKEEIIKAINQIDNNPKLRTNRQSSTYDLIFENKKYPPILVLSVANESKNGKQITLSDFGNNVEIPFKILRDNGFEIESKSGQMKLDLKEFIKVANEQGLKTTDSARDYARKHKGVNDGLNVEVSFGKGNAAAIPWIAFTSFGQKVQDGIYPVYLYYKDCEILILAYGVSETTLPSTNWTNLDLGKTIKEYFETRFSKKPARYGSSYVYKAYDVNTLPSQKVFKSDLDNIIKVYKTQFEGKKITKTPTITMLQADFSIAQFQSDISLSGLVFSETLISRFIASLITKPFVLLTGLSGSGKTKIAQSFVKWICEDESQYKIIPVGSDWTNREPLLGYPNGLNPTEYILPDSGALNLIIEAVKDENQYKPYFLILDEMNLSHVERYFADFLSVMESNDKIMLYSGTQRTSPDGTEIPSNIFWAKNLFIIGTVNIDETTYMFSPKVLDRANTIEFRIDKNNIKNFFDLPSKINLSVLEGKGASMAQHFLELAADNQIEQNDIYTETFVKFFNELKKIGAEFGYRTAVEMLQLVKKLNTIGVFTNEESIDIAVIQKLLPKLHGSRSKISKVLDALILLCLKNEQTFSITKSEDINPKNILYPTAFEKLVRMYRNALDNGFTSYAEA